MLAADKARILDKEWRKLWSSGITNPITVSEILATALMAGGARVEVAESRDSVAVAGWIRNLRQEHGILSGSEIESSSFWVDPGLFMGAVMSIAQIVSGDGDDVLGDAYEHVLSKLSTAGHFGQFRTPRHIVDFMVRVLEPAASEEVLDPACGSGGFLVAAGQRMGPSADGHLHGWEIDRSIARIAMSNAFFHGLPATSIDVRDGLMGAEGVADVVLANPPFSGDVSAEAASRYVSGSMRSEVLFVEAISMLLKAKGRAGIIVPIGVLDSVTSSAVLMRSNLIESHNVRAVVELPSYVFKPYADVRTGIIFIDDSRSRGSVRMIKLEHDGLSQNSRRRPEPASDQLPLAESLLSGEDQDLLHADVQVSELKSDQFVLSPSRWVQRPRESSEVPSLEDGMVGLEADVEELARLTSRLAGLVRSS